MLIFANKQDIQGALSEEDIRDALDLQSIKSHHWRILPCSAMTGKNLVEGLDWVVNDVAQRMYYSTTLVEETANHNVPSHLSKISA